MPLYLARSSLGLRRFWFKRTSRAPPYSVYGVIQDMMKNASVMEVWMIVSSTLLQDQQNNANMHIVVC